jgi:hypothetical protein
LLSWGLKTLRLWDSQSGTCLQVVADGDLTRLQPEWALARIVVTNPSRAVGDLFIEPSGRTSRLHHATQPVAVARWEGDADADPAASWWKALRSSRRPTAKSAS